MRRGAGGIQEWVNQRGSDSDRVHMTVINNLLKKYKSDVGAIRRSKDRERYKAATTAILESYNAGRR